MTVVYKGRAKRIEDNDLPRLGAEIGVGEDEMHAIIDVEAAGSGFDRQGRVKMLFEPHVFYRNLSGAQRTQAVNAGLAYKSWKRNYPADSYPRFLRACAINETAACKAASWGLGQILGENHRAAGYATPQRMIEDFAHDEDQHLAAIIKFIISKSLDDEIRNHNWAGFARGYNGASYKANAYDTKLAAAYRKWARIKDTELAGSPLGLTDLSAQARGPLADDDVFDANEIYECQQLLVDLGYHEVGIVGNTPGGRTAAAIEAFKVDRNLIGPAKLDFDLLAELRKAKLEGWPRPIADERKNATSADLKETNKTIKATGWTRLTAKFQSVVAFIASLFWGIIEYFGEAKEKAQPFLDVLGSVPVPLYIAAFAGTAGFIWYKTNKARDGVVEDFQDGKLLR